MSYIIEKPRKKHEAFVASIKDATTNKPVVTKLHGCRIQVIQELKNGGGHLIKVCAPCDVTHIIRELDEACKATVLENNTVWFSNNLAESEIEDFYRPSCGASLHVVSTHSKPPREIIWLGESLPSISDIPATDVQIGTYVATLVIEAQGLFFYPKRFGVRWLLRSIKVMRQDDADAAEVDESASRREEIEAYWSGELDVAVSKMADDIQRYESKIATIRNIQANLQDMLATAKSMPDPQKEWNELLESLASKIWAYTNGQESRFILF
jgi:hypothetical protein